MSSTPEEKPQRATAAQLASRKIKDVRRRRPNSSTPSATGASFSGAFNSLGPNTVSSSSPAPQPPSSSFTFGQSQSFPGASSNSSQPNQNGGSPFSFGSGTGGSSFNFSSGGGQTSSTNNPFATMSSGGNQPSSGGGQFSGFQGSLFNLPPTESSGQAQQSLPSGGLFGNNPQQSTTPGGIFGNPTSSAPSGLSGAAPASSNLFGANGAASSTPQLNLFGGSSTDKPSPFSQSTAFGESMQTSPDAKNNSSQSKPPALFGASAPSFGGSTNFGSTAAGTTSSFGAPPSTTAETPSKPLFGAALTNSSTPSAFGAATQSTSASTPSTTSTAPATSTLFSSGTPAKPDTPFSNIFGGAPTSSATPNASEGKGAEEKKAELEKPKSGFQFTPSTTAGPSLFSKSETPAAPASGLFQTPNAGSSLFTPKPAVAQEQDKPEPASPNPFQSLFSPKPTTPGLAASSTPSTEQKSLPPAAPFANLFGQKPSSPSGNAQTSGPEAPATTTPLFGAPASSLNASTSSSAPQASLFSKPTEPKPQEPATQSPAPAQSPFKPSTTISSPSVSNPASKKASTSTFENLQPSGLPGTLSQETKEEVGMHYRVRMLNVSFQREVAKLDPSSGDFEKLVSYYLRVRATLGAPVGERSPKRKLEDDQNGAIKGPSKKARPPFSGGAETPTNATSSTPTPTASTPTTATPSKPASAATPNSHKRKSPDREDDDDVRPEKRVNGDSTTANIFAQSFSKSKSSDSESTQAAPATPAGASPVKAPSLFPTPSASSPAKATFESPAKAPENSSSSLFGSSASISKPTFAAPTTNAAAAPNPFVLKPSGDKSADAASGPPKFETGSTNFFAQFKAQADKTAAKEKAKRKAEDFDSDEEDEAEWERKDAEKQRQKRQQLESSTGKRAVMVPGKGFVFEDVSGTEDKAAESASSTSGAGASVFDAKGKSPASSSNIFGHLSATPSEAEENDADDTEEDEGPKETSFAPNSEKAETPTPALSANESSDDGDITKALQKAKQPEKATTNGSTESNAGGRSLFDRVQYDEDGNPKKQGEEEEKKKKLSTFFNSSKYASSFNSPAPSAATPNPFGQSTKAQPEQAASPFSKPATPNPFGNLFGASTTSGAATPSIFATNNGTPKPANDQTWKRDSPIKFAGDSTVSSGSKIDFTAPTTASDPSKPLSTLFGGASSGPNPSTAGTSPATGFSFGGPAQKPASFLASSTFGSAVPSRTPTPGVTTDTGAEESGDGESTESLPQVDLSRGGAGEENEDVVIELRARGMKLLPSGWESQGVGYVRVLKDRTTTRGRVLLRADPSGKVVLNAALMKQIKYIVSGNSVQFLVPQAEGAPEQWAVRVKKEEVQRLGSAIEETKS
ncbi:RanBP1 domain protein [Aspergillus affinis]|uniref:RanBP1 domain protein n=1 Tax=Aspergillus affinis TaxID=1070780 RepID=UPI0022FEB7DD|nr:uncharacterized protein KD926_008557 [Aspergillus affinis]KAI9040113.1 hypothetical protein KD926_008557 [Aspergillus affinis]